MKKVFMIIAISVLLAGCTMNKSKEARIQKLESEAVKSAENIIQLEERIVNLEATIKVLEAIMLELESD